MAQIKNTIDLLAKILKANGTTLVKAETFRLAKFDRNEAVVPLWRLLFELVYYCNYGKIDSFVIETYNQLSFEEAVIYVKRELQKRGYYSADFAQLPYGTENGSRELLLAFGWLLSSEQIIQKFMTDRTSVLDDDSAGIYKDELLKQNSNSSLYLEKLPSDACSRINQLLWLNNKLRLNLCSLHSLQCQRNRLKHKIHEATFGTKAVPGVDHLSMVEVSLVRNPEFLRKNIDLLEKDSERLHDLLMWQDHEGIFWKWMESVLEAKLQMPESGLPSGTSDALSIASSRLHECHQTLQKAIVKYDSIVEHLERLCCRKIEDVPSEVLDDIISRINLELSIQKANLAVRGQKVMRFMNDDWKPTEPRFVLQKKQKAQNQKPAFVDSETTSQTESQSSFTSFFSVDRNYNSKTNIDDEIDCLEQSVKRLENEVSKKQNLLRVEIEKLSTKLADSVCIPPLCRNLVLSGGK